MRRIKMIGAAVVLTALASLPLAPAAHASCDESGCTAPSDDVASTVQCVADYHGPLKNVGSCFLRP